MKDTRIRLNVGGTQFHCYKKTLRRFPGSRLERIANFSETDTDAYACVADDDVDFDVDSNEYFYDRNPLMFSFILEACRSGLLHLPRGLCGKIIMDEMDFWGISADVISECCWKTFYKSDNEIQEMEYLTGNYFRNTASRTCHDSQKQTLKTRLWLLLDEPRTSKFAMAWAAMVMLAVVCSVFITVAESLDVARQHLSEEEKFVKRRMITILGLANSSDAVLKKFDTGLKPSLLLLDAGCFVLITVDVVLCLLTCPSKIAYLKSVQHICEIVGIIDFWLGFATEWNMEYVKSDIVLYLFLVFRALYFLKVVRLFRLCRYVPALNIMELSILKSRREIYGLGAIMFILVFIFGYLMADFELLFTDSIDNAFMAMYWATITLTTVGYGDVYPKSTAGRMLACVCAICGVIMLALPVGVIAANFNALYSHYRYAENHIRKYHITSVRRRCQ